MNNPTDIQKSNRRMVDSGVEWIGEIPEGWQVKKLKEVSEIGKGKPLPPEYDVVEAKDGTPYLNGGQNPSFFINLTGNTAAGTIAVSSGGASAGFSQLLTQTTWVGGDCHTVTAKKVNQDYLAWALKGGEEVRTSNQTGTAMPHVNKSDLEIEFVTIPTTDEQQSIASYLDHHTSLIDRERELISAKIEALREQRKALIFECVTGKRRIVEVQHLAGVDDWSDIVCAGGMAAVPVARKDDPFVKEGRLVDSGVEWIGEIPEGWEVVRLGSTSTIETGSMNTEDREDDGKYPLYVRSQHVELCNRYTHDTEAILVPGEGLVGEVFHLARGKHAVHQRVYSIQPKSNKIEYIRYAMMTGFGGWAKQNSNTVTVESLRRPTFLNFILPLPPLPEQQAVASHLDHYTTLIDKKIALLVEKNNLLSEQRKALIFEAVTGKLDIHG